MTKPPSTSNASSKKVIKNQPRPKVQTVKAKVVKHFEPLRSKLPWQNQVVQGIPEIDNNVDDKFDTTPSVGQSRSPRIIQRCGIKPNLVKKIPDQGTPNAIRKRISPPEESTIKPAKTIAKRFQSSSSSSVGSAQSPRKKHVLSKQFRGRPNHLSTKPDSVSFHKSFTTKVIQKDQTGDFSSSVDSALLEKDLRLQSIKDEILSNKRLNNFAEFTRSIGEKEDVKYDELKDEIAKSRMDDVQRRKLWINDLKSEIEQFRKFDSFEVYTIHQHKSKHLLDSEDGESSHSGDIEAIDLDDPDECGNFCAATTDDDETG